MVGKLLKLFLKIRSLSHCSFSCAGFFSFILLLISCTEVWDGNIKPADDLLVVKALITDQEGPQTVELYNTAGYGQRAQQSPQSGAIVYVQDEMGQQWMFNETTAGKYIIDNLIAQTGKAYVLHVELEDGSRYESAPQILQTVLPLDTIIAESASSFIDMYDHDLELVPEWVQGVELYTDIDMEAGFSRRIRFVNEVMFQYNVVLRNRLVCLQYLPGNYLVCNHIDPLDPPRMSCRTRLPLNDVVNLTMPGMDLPVGDVYQHNLGFAPLARRYYNLFFPGLLDRRVLITSQYSLTDEAFNFYRQIREQLLAENAIFDPVPTQITGNMRSVSDPDRAVIGLFEVAGKTSQTFVFSHEPWQTGSVWLKEIDDLSFLPQHECLLETIPDHWIFY